MKTANITLENECTGYSTEPTTYLKSQLAAARQLLHTWRRRAYTRHALSQLPPRLLEDAGIEPSAARRESSKPFWKG
jgi:uncharacterized protein YjiS (DUF1127 family)